MLPNLRCEILFGEPSPLQPLFVGRLSGISRSVRLGSRCATVADDDHEEEGQQGIHVWLIGQLWN